MHFDPKILVCIFYNSAFSQGDGGGPLACRMKSDPSRYIQVGITAWGIGCGTKDVPGVYANVPLHYEWIKETIKKYAGHHPWYYSNALLHVR